MWLFFCFMNYTCMLFLCIWMGVYNENSYQQVEFTSYFWLSIIFNCVLLYVTKKNLYVFAEKKVS